MTFGLAMAYGILCKSKKGGCISICLTLDLEELLAVDNSPHTYWKPPTHDQCHRATLCWKCAGASVRLFS
jgi:hypothetical protein